MTKHDKLIFGTILSVFFPVFFALITGTAGFYRFFSAFLALNERELITFQYLVNRSALEMTIRYNGFHEREIV